MKKHFKFICIICILLCVVIMLCACNEKNETYTVENTVETPYGTLTLPDEFKDNVNATVVTEDPYTLSFEAVDGTELFTIYFGKETENLLGTLKIDEQNVVLYATFGVLDSNNENYETFCGYQEGIDTILKGLIDSGNFAVNEALEFEDYSTFDIATSVVTMKYPAKWKEKVQIEVTDDGVRFTTDGTPLFDLMFIECDGYLLGTYRDVPIFIVDYEVKTEEQRIMQGDVNVILEYLEDDPDFEANYQY